MQIEALLGTDAPAVAVPGLGERLYMFRDANKMTLQLLSEVSGIELGTLERMEARDECPNDIRLLQRLAAALHVGLGELFPVGEDTSTGVRILRSGDCFDRVVQRRGKDFYKYVDLVRSTEISGMVPRILELYCHERDDNELNHGHALHQFTLVLEGRVGFHWKYNGREHSQEMEPGDSWYIRPWVPHSFTSLSRDATSKIFVMTFAGPSFFRAEEKLQYPVQVHL